MTTSKTILSVGALLLVACPYDPESVGLTPVDGGYAYDNGMDGGVFIASVDVDAAGPDTLPEPPTMAQMCTLWIGDVHDMTNAPKRFGIWIGDVRRVFGPPPRNGEMDGEDSATINYQWDGPMGSPAGMELSFEFVLLNLKDSNGDPTRMHLSDSYFLNGIRMRDGSFFDCWRWELKEPGLTPCPECLDSSAYDQCTAHSPDPRDCF